MGALPCRHKVCQRHQGAGEPWHCYLEPAPRPDDFTTYSCRCGTQTQGGIAGLTAHQQTVGCTRRNLLPLDFTVTPHR